jgi:flagellar protein FliL
MNKKVMVAVTGFLISLNFAGLGMGVYMVYISTIGYTSPAITEQKLRDIAGLPSHLEQGPMVYTMEKFVANLAGEPKRTLRIQVNLDMMNARSYSEIMDEENRARARDTILRILNEKTFTDLESLQGKLFLKDEIISNVNKSLRIGLVKDIFFSDFVMN